MKFLKKTVSRYATNGGLRKTIRKRQLFSIMQKWYVH